MIINNNKNNFKMKKTSILTYKRNNSIFLNKKSCKLKSK